MVGPGRGDLLRLSFIPAILIALLAAVLWLRAEVRGWQLRTLIVVTMALLGAVYEIATRNHATLDHGQGG